jgi:UDP-N-acetylmuramate-alanine ligase
VAGLIKAGDMVITMGAGDITKYNQKIRKTYAEVAARGGATGALER